MTHWEELQQFILARTGFPWEPEADSPELLLVWRLQKTRCDQTGPSSFSIDGGGTCRRSAPSCGTSSQWGKSTPSLPQVLASAEERRKNLQIFHFFSIPPPSPSLPVQEQSGQISFFVVWSVSSCDGRGTFSLLQPRIWVYHQEEWLFHIPSLEGKG